MRDRKKIQSIKNASRKSSDLLRGFLMVTVCSLTAVAISVGTRVLDDNGRSRVYAAADAASAEEFQDQDVIFTGIAGVVGGLKKSAGTPTSVERIGTSCEQVMVGQRVKKIDHRVSGIDLSSSLENTVERFEETTETLAQTPAMMTDGDYDTLLHIVEAEAGTEDVKGRVLVANVIMNRVNHEEFPDTVTEVVWQNTNGVPQFSPTYDGRIHEVTVSEETKEAVRQALNGTDYSQGALFFIQKSEAEAHNVSWFEKDLKRLFKYGVHEFYTYPNEEKSADAENSASSEKASAEQKGSTGSRELVQMVSLS